MAGQAKQCRDCPPGSKRKIKAAGRCATHHREVTAQRRAAAHEKRVQQVYGLMPGEYEQILAFQGGRCYICRRATGKTRKLSVDHDHATGYVRGLLCRPCNTMLGKGRDATDFFQRAIDYLLRPPAQAMGLWRKGPS